LQVCERNKQKQLLVVEYARGGAAQGDVPAKSHIVRSIVAALMFMPVGVVAVIFSVRAIFANRQGRYFDAALLAERAVEWSVVALVAFLIFIYGAVIVVSMWD
jgi:hypothetical protein